MLSEHVLRFLRDNRYMSAKLAKQKKAQQRAAAKRGKKPARSKRPLYAHLRPREMTMEDLQGVIASTSSKVVENSGLEEETVNEAIVKMVELGYLGISDDNTLSMLKPLPKK